jgi:hypothetical protein
VDVAFTVAGDALTGGNGVIVLDSAGAVELGILLDDDVLLGLGEGSNDQEGDNHEGTHDESERAFNAKKKKRRKTLSRKHERTEFIIGHS